MLILPCICSIHHLDFGHYHARDIAACIGVVIGRLLPGFFLHANFLSTLLMSQNLLLVLLETHKVKVQVLNTIFFEKILTDQAAQIYASLGQSIIFVKTAVSLYRTEVATIIAHV